LRAPATLGTPPVGGSVYEKPQSGCALCAVFLRPKRRNNGTLGEYNFVYKPLSVFLPFHPQAAKLLRQMRNALVRSPHIRPIVTVSTPKPPDSTAQRPPSVYHSGNRHTPSCPRPSCQELLLAPPREPATTTPLFVRRRASTPFESPQPCTQSSRGASSGSPRGQRAVNRYFSLFFPCEAQIARRI
jgi:hypothetical protein